MGFSVDAFLDNSECPVCGTSDLIEGPLKEKDGEVYRKIACNGCGRLFKAILAPVDILPVEDVTELSPADEDGLTFEDEMMSGTSCITPLLGDERED